MRQNYARNEIAKARTQIRPEHKPAIDAFFDRMANRQIRESSLRNYAIWLRKWSQWYAKPLEAVTTDDVRAFQTYLRETGASPHSRHTAGILLGAFYKQLLGKDNRPALFWEEIRGPVYRSPPTAIPVTQKEFAALLNAAPRLRDRMILMVLRESGLRASEFCALNVGSIQLDEDGKGVWVSLPEKGDRLKTGPREVYLVHSRAILETYLESHPNRNDPAAPLVAIESGRGRGNRFFYMNLQDSVRRAALRAGVYRMKGDQRRPITPHLLRITRATESANLGWNEELMRKHFGWSTGSDMPSHYTRINRNDLRARVLNDSAPQPAPAPQPTAAAPTAPQADVLGSLAASQAAIVELLRRSLPPGGA